METLPPELYRPIIQHLDKKSDIIHLLCCSKTFQRECEPIIYAEIVLNGATPQQLFQLTRNSRTASLIISLTFIAQRNYSLNDVPAVTDGDGFRTYDTSLANRGFLQPALEALPNLKSLKLRTYFPSISPFMGPVFDNVPFKLHAFSCPYIWDADMVRFLSGQTELRTLEWHESIYSGSTTIPIISSKILLNLTNIRTNSNVIVHLVPNRPISRVHHNTLRARVHNLPLLLSQASAKIEVLVFGLLAIDRDELESWKCHLPDLRFLECVVGRANQSSLYTILPSLTKLTKLILHGMGDRDGLSTDESYQLVAKAFDLAPSLRVVEREVILPPDSDDLVAFLQWKRGGGDPVPRDTLSEVNEWLYY